MGSPPKSPELLLREAMDHHRAGDLRTAEVLYRQVLERDPGHGDALHLLGGIAGRTGRLDRAEQLIRAAITHKPHIALYHANLAWVLIQRKAYEQALATCERALALQFDCVEAHNHMGIALHHLARFSKARAAYDAALRLQPGFAPVHNNKGNACKQSGDLEQAEACYRRALALQPGYAEAGQNLAAILLHRGLSAEAQTLLERLPAAHSPPFHNLLGMVYQIQGKTAAARTAYRRALELEPDHPLWRIRLHAVCPVIAPHDRALRSWRKQFREGLKKMPPVDLAQYIDELPSSHAEPPYHMTYQDRDNRAPRQEYANLFSNSDLRPVKPKKTGPLTIAFLVTAGHEGIFMKCTRGILEHWGLTGTTLTVVAPSSSLDFIKSRVQNTHLRFLTLPANLREAVSSLRRHAFHLIYFWEIGSDATNYFLPFFRLAPVQCTSWGTPDTTGIPEVDYYLSSRAWETEAARSHYSERLVLLDKVPTCFEPVTMPRKPGRTRTHFGMDQGDHFYFCVQNLFKIHPDCDLLWAELMARDPKARVVLVEGKQSYWTELLKTRFKRTMKQAAQRVMFLPRLSYDDYLSLVADADVLLDSLHFSGGNTSYEGLALGTPILTLPGEFIRGRFTLGCYHQLDLWDCVAEDREDFLVRAVRIASDPQRRRTLSEKIRAAGSRLFLDKEAVAVFERTLTRLAGEGN